MPETYSFVLNFRTRLDAARPLCNGKALKLEGIISVTGCGGAQSMKSHFIET